MKCVENRRERKVLRVQWCVTEDIKELVQGQPSLTATTPPDIHPRLWELCSADMGQWRLEMCGFITSVCVCVWSSFSFCVRILDASLCLFLYLIPWGAAARLRRWSRAAGRRVCVFRQWTGNLNLHTPCLQLPALLPQDPGLLLHALRFVPHPAEH